jgi:hypothetical protein
MAMLGRFLLSFAGLAVLFACGVARASPTYPPTIADHLMISCQPPCTICHRDLSGGLGTVNKRFGQNLQALYGLTSENPSLLISALDKAKADNLDSDGNGPDSGGDTDINALLACRDPNQPPGSNIQGPQWGCATAHGAGKGAAAVGLFGAMCVLTTLRRRRRRAK